MYHGFNFKDVLAVSTRPSWAVEDVLPPGAQLDYTRRFMPEGLARTAVIPFLGDDEKRILNQIRGHEYLAMFGLVEEFVLPFVLDHARPHLSGDDYRIRALLQFAGEEAKHIQLFKAFHRLFTESFASECAVIGPPEAIAAEILRHDPLAVALVILQVEWMTQLHYVDSVKDDGDLDPLFKSLLKHHWIEEAQHAKLDTLMVEALGEGRDEASIQRAIDEYFEIGGFLDNGFKVQAGFNLDALEAVTGRKLENRDAILEQQHQAARWTYVGSGMVHERFKATLLNISANAAARIAEAAPVFA